MKRWAFLKNGIVDLIVEQESEPTVFGYWIECPNNIGPNWKYDSGNFYAPSFDSEAQSESTILMNQETI